MKTTADHSLWRWICIRISIFSICSVFVFVASIWLRYALQALWIKQQMPDALRQEYALIKAHPPADPGRFHQIVDQWWGLSYSDPNIAAEDWLTIAVLLVILIPCLVFWGLKTVRPLAVQFSRLTGAARTVARGDFSAQAQALENAPAEMTSFVQDFNHMTRQLARYERELRASHVAMAHELRSPLTAAMGRLQGIMDGVFAPDQQQLSMIMKQLQSLNQLADGLQLLSLADADRLVLEYHPFNLTDLLKERIAWIHPRAEQAGLVITLDADSQCLLQADAAKIGQVMTLLLENTLAYASEGKRLAIRVRQQTTAIEITFRDAGPGVSPEFLAAMFERFTRADGSRARNSGGCGLGLSIARAICQAHQGEISASLPASGGLEICVRLPFCAPLTVS
ncbi:sensor histidine kinase [Phytobacter sp. V91]|uniref:sensor histidine kinase n=1 Tax=Phytobacter sp. V91 TaxID=3369425 RepID=UPI003F61D927